MKSLCLAYAFLMLGWVGSELVRHTCADLSGIARVKEGDGYAYRHFLGFRTAGVRILRVRAGAVVSGREAAQGSQESFAGTFV
jgi:hypothetical protein